MVNSPVPEDVEHWRDASVVDQAKLFAWLEELKMYDIPEDQWVVRLQERLDSVLKCGSSFKEQ